jgi:hypothetical protein
MVFGMSCQYSGESLNRLDFKQSMVLNNYLVECICNIY